MIKVESINMILGERRRLTLQVTVEGKSTGFEPRDARCTLIGEQQEEQFFAEIHGSEIVLYLEPRHVGKYILTVTFSLGGEIIKKRLNIRVAE